MKCHQCQKLVPQPAGKRAKKFCNDTCRSNFWYGKNKKGQKVNDGKTHNHVAVDEAKENDRRNPVDESKDQKLEFEKTTNISIPKNLDQLKEMCPFPKGSDEARVWVSIERQKYKI